MTAGHSPHYVRLGTPAAAGQPDGSYAVTVPLVAEDPAVLPEWTGLLEKRMSAAAAGSQPFFTLAGTELAFPAASRDEVGARVEQVAEWIASTNQAYTDELVTRNEAAARETIDDEAPPADQWMADRQTSNDYRTNPKP
jgi:hypothetical protein